MKKRKAREKNKKVKERNQFVVPALFRRAGSHRKSNKALRKQLKQQMIDE